jgi:hypothetical protein
VLTIFHKISHPGSDETPTDVISWLLKAKDENDQSAPPGDKALDEDGRLIIIAGRCVHEQFARKPVIQPNFCEK